MGGCGTDEEAAKKAAAQEKARQKAAEAKLVYEGCKSHVGDLIDSLEEITSRLDIGLNYENYSQELGDVKVAYDKAFDDTDVVVALGEDCVSNVAVPAENALNSHLKASILWDRCIEDFDCDPDANEKKMQKHWQRAQRQIAKSQSGLEDLAP